MDFFATLLLLKGEQMKSSLQTTRKTTRKPRGSLSEKQHQVLQAHAFQPGESGNPSGRPCKLMTEAYRRALERKIAGDPDGRTYADAIAEQMIRLGLKGSVRAVAEVSTRADGLPQQFAADRHNRHDVKQGGVRTLRPILFWKREQWPAPHVLYEPIITGQRGAHV